MKLAVAKIAESISAKAESRRDEVAQGYSIDSRTIGASDLFFAVKGERLDGHDFVSEALDKGAAAAVVRGARVVMASCEVPVTAPTFLPSRDSGRTSRIT